MTLIGDVHRHLSLLLLFALLLPAAGAAQTTPSSQPPVVIASKPSGLVYGTLPLPVTARAPVERIQLDINGVKFAEQHGTSAIFNIPVGLYLRRLRVRAAGFDAQNQLIGEDTMVINDPQPPFRLRLLGSPKLPGKGRGELTATVTAPANTPVKDVDFFVGNELVATDAEAPWSVSFDVAKFPDAGFATATAHGLGGLEASDVFFWGSTPGESIDVQLQQIPLSVSGPRVPRLGELTLLDDGEARKIEAMVPANDQPLNVIILLDSSESMLGELPVVKEAARRFVRSLIRPRDQYAVVAFAQATTWLTGFTSDVTAIDRAVEQLYPRGQTHLYDSVIEMLFELQKMPGRHALVVLTDGVNQGGHFNLDNLVHYARYAGVPVYPIIKNRLLSRAMRFGLRGFGANRFAAIARDSGATWFIIQSPKELPTVYEKISAELQRQQVIMFYSQGTGSDEWHSLALEWPGGDEATVRIPRGYFP